MLFGWCLDSTKVCFVTWQKLNISFWVLINSRVKVPSINYKCYVTTSPCLSEDSAMRPASDLTYERVNLMFWTKVVGNDKNSHLWRATSVCTWQVIINIATAQVTKSAPHRNMWWYNDSDSSVLFELIMFVFFTTSHSSSDFRRSRVDMLERRHLLL